MTALLVEVSICGLKGTRPLVKARTKGKRRPPHRRPSAASPLLSRTEDRCSFNIDAKEQENRFRFSVLCQCLYIKFRQPPPPLLLPPPPPKKKRKKEKNKKINNNNKIIIVECMRIMGIGSTKHRQVPHVVCRLPHWVTERIEEAFLF